jgi:hypothetical protein
MIGACVAAYFAIRAPSKEDLARVEAHTAESAKHIAEQNRRESLNTMAERVSIAVSGRDRMMDPMKLTFTLKDPGVSLRRVELANDLGMVAGVVDCAPAEALSFAATLEPPLAHQWFESGGVRQSSSQKMLVIRAFLIIEGHEAVRRFSVQMFLGSQHPPGHPEATEGVYLVSGTC